MTQPPDTQPQAPQEIEPTPETHPELFEPQGPPPAGAPRPPVDPVPPPDDTAPDPPAP